MTKNFQNHICTSQLRRSEEDRCNMKERLRVAADNERVIRDELGEAKTKIAHMESKVSAKRSWRDLLGCD